MALSLAYWTADPMGYQMAMMMAGQMAGQMASQMAGQMAGQMATATGCPMVAMMTVEQMAI
jgi:hypothetical protein